jgi:pimeloyl-ACP methyl ester carboxylesterase
VRVDEHTIDLDGTPAHYRTAPGASPPTLYLHTIPTSGEDWSALLERTGGIAPDLPGFGHSGKGGHLDYSIDGHADFLQRLLDELEIPQVKLVAHGWGAGGGLALAEREPARVERLVLIDPLAPAGVLRPHPLARLWRVRGVGELTMGFTGRRLLARLLRGASESQDGWPAERLRTIWEEFDQGTQRAILRLHRSDVPTADAWPPPLSMRALILWGEQDPWFSSDLARHYGGRFAGAKVEGVADAGHWPWLDQPALTERIARFLGDP